MKSSDLVTRMVQLLGYQPAPDIDAELERMENQSSTRALANFYGQLLNDAVDALRIDYKMTSTIKQKNPYIFQAAIEFILPPCDDESCNEPGHRETITEKFECEVTNDLEFVRFACNRFVAWVDDLCLRGVLKSGPKLPPTEGYDPHNDGDSEYPGSEPF